MIPATIPAFSSPITKTGSSPRVHALPVGLLASCLLAPVGGSPRPEAEPAEVESGVCKAGVVAGDQEVHWPPDLS